MGALQVRASGMWARKQWIAEHHGEAGYDVLARELSPAGRLLLREPIDPKQWINYLLFIEVVIAMDRVFGAGDGTLAIELGRDSAHRNTSTVLKPFIRLGSVGWVLRRASKVWREHFSEGAFEVRFDEPARTAEGEIVDFPYPHIVHTYTVLGFAIGCVELSGASDVTGQVASCRSRGADRTLLRVRWA